VSGLQELWSALEIKVSTTVAGLIGGILALSMMPKLTFRKAVTAVIGGAACAAYATPLAVYFFSIENRNLENALAFVMGVVGMNVLGGIFTLSERWRRAPTLDPEKIKDL
jgi:uncharacterized membrane protein YeaQ/YmgE (transglycosylase-associated protein family)